MTSLGFLRLRPLHQKTITVISCYSPTLAVDDSELDAFYEDLEEVIRIESFYNFVVGDFNAKIEIPEEGSIGSKFSGLGNENGEESTEAGAGCITPRATGSHHQLQNNFARRSSKEQSILFKAAQGRKSKEIIKAAPGPDHVSADLLRTSPTRDACGTPNVLPSKGRNPEV
ncbi:unnamed protein product [Strongylus vulgaris]|uniref:Endonuclease/exonuclease/phosphatase domain-containing protein n=1 Tax=Strongylus vulgaris TaxID=40348 RepID=A0A3P7IQD3_STRVU|nr:unnamed protein product [Strongylus vulgaris]